MTTASPTPLAERLRRAGWLVLCAALIPAGVAQWRSHERLLQPTKHEPAPPDWVRYDAAREHFADVERVHIYTDVETRLVLLRRFDLQFSALPALIWDDPPGRNPSAPPDDRTAFLIDARTPWKARDFTTKITEAALEGGYRTSVHEITPRLRVLRFKHVEPDG